MKNRLREKEINNTQSSLKVSFSRSSSNATDYYVILHYCRLSENHRRL